MYVGLRRIVDRTCGCLVQARITDEQKDTKYSEKCEAKHKTYGLDTQVDSPIYPTSSKVLRGETGDGEIRGGRMQ